MVSHSEIADFLSHRGVKPTPNRVLVLKTLADSEFPMTLADVEAEITSIDKASIFRVLELFTQKDIVHVIKDDSRSLKYEICRSEHHSIDDQHVHFYCKKCGKIIDLFGEQAPKLEGEKIVEGNIIQEEQLYYKGICAKCAKKLE